MSAAPSASSFSFPSGILFGNPLCIKRFGAITVETFQRLILFFFSLATTNLRNSSKAWKRGRFSWSNHREQQEVNLCSFWRDNLQPYHISVSSPQYYHLFEHGCCKTPKRASSKHCRSLTGISEQGRKSGNVTLRTLLHRTFLASSSSSSWCAWHMAGPCSKELRIL